MDIVEFLNARIDEDERRLDAPEFDEIESVRGPGWGTRGDCPICDAYMFDGNEVVTEEGWYDHAETVHGRSRVLAECSSKREVIAVHPKVMTIDTALPGQVEYPWVDQPACNNCRGDECDEWYREPYPCVTLKALALPYADHPDYEPGWAL